jgi:hypothetical protein
MCIEFCTRKKGARGVAVGWGTALVQFQMVSFVFGIDIILWPCSDSASNRNEYQNYSWLNLLEPSGPAQACTGIAVTLLERKKAVEHGC